MTDFTFAPRVAALFDQHCEENRHCAASEKHALAVQQVKEILELAATLEAEAQQAHDAYIALREMFKETEQ